MADQHNRPSIVPQDQIRLPASFRTKDNALYLPSLELRPFVEVDLSVERLETIAPYLWVAGRPYLPRALNIQAVLNRTIVPTTDASLHLVWRSSKIFVKVLPAYFLTINFYRDYLRPGISPQPYGPALGLLLSYLALVPTELDFAIAQQAHLLPSDLTWSEWILLVRSVLTDYPGNAIYAHLPKRYIYGELRLDRLDIIYRYLHSEWLYGYSRMTSPQTYGEMISQNLVTLGAIVFYIILVLSAMQLGLSTKKDALIVNESFQKACYIFAAFAILAPLFAVATIITLAVVMFFTHWGRTIKAEERRFRELNVPPFRKKDGGNKSKA